MSGQTPYRKLGPETYSPADNAVVRGGRLVEGVAGGRIQEAQANSLVVLGVAYTDAIAPEDVNTSSTDGLGRPVQSFVGVPTQVAVGHGETHKVTYTADTAFGQALKAGAAGTVTPVAADGDPRLIIGRCVEPAGVVVATNAVGLARINP